jgi:hypothetical protein
MNNIQSVSSAVSNAPRNSKVSHYSRLAGTSLLTMVVLASTIMTTVSSDAHAKVKPKKKPAVTHQLKSKLKHKAPVQKKTLPVSDSTTTNNPALDSALANRPKYGPFLPDTTQSITKPLSAPKNTTASIPLDLPSADSNVSNNVFTGKDQLIDEVETPEDTTRHPTRIPLALPFERLMGTKVFTYETFMTSAQRAAIQSTFQGPDATLHYDNPLQAQKDFEAGNGRYISHIKQSSDSTLKALFPNGQAYYTITYMPDAEVKGSYQTGSKDSLRANDCKIELGGAHAQQFMRVLNSLNNDTVLVSNQYLFFVNGQVVINPIWMFSLGLSGHTANALPLKSVPRIQSGHIEVFSITGTTRWYIQMQMEHGERPQYNFGGDIGWVNTRLLAGVKDLSGALGRAEWYVGLSTNFGIHAFDPYFTAITNFNGGYDLRVGLTFWSNLQVDYSRQTKNKSTVNGLDGSSQRVSIGYGF